MTEEEEIDMLVKLFRWDDTRLDRYHAMAILRRARYEASTIPSYDDFCAGVRR